MYMQGAGQEPCGPSASANLGLFTREFTGSGVEGTGNWAVAIRTISKEVRAMVGSSSHKLLTLFLF